MPNRRKKTNETKCSHQANVLIRWIFRFESQHWSMRNAQLLKKSLKLALLSHHSSSYSSVFPFFWSTCIFIQEQILISTFNSRMFGCGHFVGSFQFLPLCIVHLDSAHLKTRNNYRASINCQWGEFSFLFFNQFRIAVYLCILAWKLMVVPFFVLVLDYSVPCVRGLMVPGGLNERDDQGWKRLGAQELESSGVLWTRLRWEPKSCTTNLEFIFGRRGKKMDSVVKDRIIQKWLQINFPIIFFIKWRWISFAVEGDKIDEQFWELFQMHLSFSSGVGLLPETFFKTLSYTWHPTSPYTPITFGWPHTIPHDVSSIMFSLVIQSETWPSSNCKTMEAIPNFSTETTARSKLIQRASKFNLKVFFSICDHEVVFCTLDAMPDIFFNHFQWVPILC